MQGFSHQSVLSVSLLPAEFAPTLRSLFGNPLYVIYLCITILQFNSLIGMVTYKPKYIEQHYGQSAYKANFLMGEQEVFWAICSLLALQGCKVFRVRWIIMSLL